MKEGKNCRGHPGDQGSSGQIVQDLEGHRKELRLFRKCRGRRLQEQEEVTSLFREVV